MCILLFVFFCWVVKSKRKNRNFISDGIEILKCFSLIINIIIKSFHLFYSGYSYICRSVLFFILNEFRAVDKFIFYKCATANKYETILSYAFVEQFSRFLASLYGFQDALLYQPNEPDTSRTLVQTPDTFHLPYETIIIETPDNEKLHGFLIKQINRTNERETLVFFHGNAGNIGHRYVIH